MAYADYKTAMEGQSWTPEQIEEFRQLFAELQVMKQIIRLGRLQLTSAKSRWDNGLQQLNNSLPAGFMIPNPTNKAGTSAISRNKLASEIMNDVDSVMLACDDLSVDEILPIIGTLGGNSES